MKKPLFSELTEEQRQKLGKLVRDNHVYAHENAVVEYILKASHEDSDTPFSYDDITNNTPTAEWVYVSPASHLTSWESLTEEMRDEKLEHFEYLRDKSLEYTNSLIDAWRAITPDNLLGEMIAKDKWLNSGETTERYTAICDELSDLDFDDYPEIMQWLSCSSNLIYSLEQLGECTLDISYWGRTCFGQCVSLDSCIQEIGYNWYLDEILKED